MEPTCYQVLPEYQKKKRSGCPKSGLRIKNGQFEILDYRDSSLNYSLFYSTWLFICSQLG